MRFPPSYALISIVPLSFVLGALAAESTSEHDAYSSSSERISKDFDNHTLQNLGFVYKPGQTITKKDVRHVQNQIHRARMLHPDEEREVRKSGHRQKGVFNGSEQESDHWKGTGESNAKFLYDRRASEQAKMQKRKERESAWRESEYQRTGKRPLTQHYVNKLKRLAVANSGDGEGLMTFRSTGSKQKLVLDPQGRSKEEYLRHYKQKEKLHQEHRNLVRKVQRATKKKS